ncbi:hypothetical protein AB6B38_10620 [Glycocaulis abyssi]|uniref:Uncharacterized protein n=1 Tax=Glycocaulis abyssi TaxID=1433403 RepID=A0ABV9NDF1_9PROT
MDLQFLSSLFNITKRPLAAMAGAGASCVALIYFSWVNEEVSRLTDGGWLIPMFVSALLLGAPIGVTAFSVILFVAECTKQLYKKGAAILVQNIRPRIISDTLRKLPRDEKLFLIGKLRGRDSHIIGAPSPRLLYLFRRLEKKGVCVQYNEGYRATYFVSAAAWSVISERPEVIGMRWAPDHHDGLKLYEISAKRENLDG